MDEISVIGIDLAKSVFELCALTGSGETAWTKRLRRGAFMRFMEDKAPRCLVGMEACGGAHYWGRFVEGRGFGVKLMAPRQVKPYRAGPHKSDARDAAAIAEAASRPHVKAVRVKSEAAQACQALSRIRARRMRQRVQTSNQLRGLLHESASSRRKGAGGSSRRWRGSTKAARCRRASAPSCLISPPRSSSNRRRSPKRRRH